MIWGNIYKQLFRDIRFQVICSLHNYYNVLVLLKNIMQIS